MPRRAPRRRRAARRSPLPPPRPGPLPAGRRIDGLALAQRRFLAGERLSPERLAGELGISRATAYRRFGNAEQLAGTVIARLAEATFHRCSREARGRGAERVVDHLSRGMRYIATNQAYRAFLERDPQKALWIVTSKAGPVQARTIALNEGLLEEEVKRGNLRLPVDAHTMAYALVRLAEAFLYADMITGEKPDLEKASQILSLMLRGHSTV
jgi:AcrR family transcriptional regulator